LKRDLSIFQPLDFQLLGLFSGVRRLFEDHSTAADEDPGERKDRRNQEVFVKAHEPLDIFAND
jgi:hypothetical protein